MTQSLEGVAAGVWLAGGHKLTFGQEKGCVLTGSTMTGGADFHQGINWMPQRETGWTFTVDLGYASNGVKN